jgi:hypothetical protein
VTTKEPSTTDKNNGTPGNENVDDDDIIDDDDDDDDDEGDDEDDDDDDEDDDDEVEETTPADPDDAIEKPEKIDMQGYTYRAYVRKNAGSDTIDDQMANGNNRFFCIDFWVEEEEREQDAISYAVYNRNSKIEAEYNCKIRQVSSNGSQIEHLINAYTNGEGYDLTIISAKPAAQAATQNLLKDLNGMELIDLKHDAFDPNSVIELSFENNLYYVSGDMNISTLEVAGLSLVNMDFYADLTESIVDAFGGDTSYADIYTLVTAKKWTMETLMTIATMASIDADETDGDDLSVVDKGDTIGYFQYFNSAIWYFYSSRC